MPLSKQELCQKLGQRIRKLRQDKGLSLEQLALEAGLEYSQVSRIELGKINTSIHQVYSLSQALDIPMSSVFDAL